MSQLLNAQSLNASTKRAKTERVELPELDGHVFVLRYSGKQRSDFECEFTKNKIDPKARPDQFRIALLRHSIVDEKGAPIFTEKTAKDFLDQDADIVERLVNKSLELAGLSQSDVEELEKN